MNIRHINIEVTKTCNQRCFYCFNNSQSSISNNALSVEEWSTLLEKAKDNGLKSVHLTGGEPFAYKRAIELINRCVDIGLETSILSNGLKIKNLSDKYPKIFSQLILAQISLDSLDQNLHNKRRGYHRAYTDAVSAIRSLHKLKVPIEISMSVDYQNINEINLMKDFAKQFSARLILRPLVQKGRNKINLYQEIHDSISHYEKYDNIDIVDKFKYVTNLPINDKSILSKGFLTLLPKGDIVSEYLNKRCINNFSDLLKVA